MRALVARGLDETAALWSPIRLTYAWVHRAAHILANAGGRSVEELRRDYRHLLGEMSTRRDGAGPLEGAVAEFVKVTKSYWPGLFRCYRVPDLPRTNNELEQLFGAVRYGERRASGRKGASPALVVRGSVRMVAAVATPPDGFAAADLRPGNLDQWRQLRAELEGRRASRRAQLRFRRDPDAFLQRLEAQMLKQTLPS